MNYFDRMTAMALYNYDLIDKEKLERQINSALREVERDARHKATELIYSLANDIHNMRHDT